MPQNCIAPRPEENDEVMVQDMSDTQSKSVLTSQSGLQVSMYPITLKVCFSHSLSLSPAEKDHSCFDFLLSFEFLSAKNLIRDISFSSSSSSLVVVV